LYFNTETIDFDKPVTVTTQKIQLQDNKLVPGEKKTSYKKKVEKDLAVLMYGYKNFRDPNRLYDARVSILLESTLVHHSSPEWQRAIAVYPIYPIRGMKTNEEDITGARRLMLNITSASKELSRLNELVPSHGSGA
jgi:hypothetical protein